MGYISRLEYVIEGNGDAKQIQNVTLVYKTTSRFDFNELFKYRALSFTIFNNLSRFINILLNSSVACAIISLCIDISFYGEGVALSAVSYNKLWKLLIDKNLSKTEMRKMAGVSTNVIAKLGRGESVSMDTLTKICVALNCDISDIVEMSTNKEEQTQ